MQSGPVDSRIRMTTFKHVAALYWRRRPYFYAALGLRILW